MSAKRNWIVTVECKVVKEVCVEGCTEEEARANPFDHAVEEREIEQRDWTVRSVAPNE
jgi:hypothetical protein